MFWFVFKEKKGSYLFKSCVTRVDLLIKLLIIIKILIIKLSLFKKGRAEVQPVL